MNIIYLYHPEKPKRGQIKKGSLSDPVMAMQPVKSLLLLQRSQQSRSSSRDSASVAKAGQDVNTLEIRNRKVRIPVSPSKMLKWCHIHRLRNITENHIVRYEPVFSSPESQKFITSMKLYECKTSMNLQLEDDEECNEEIKATRKCFTVVASWSRGSEGFTFPIDVGYPIDSNTIDSLLLEVHYRPIYKKQLDDSSGFRIVHTKNRRKHDAGTLAIGIEPNFLHIIAPGFKRVISVGHCTSNCTRKALPSDGINIFGVNMQTHSLGRKMKIGLVRNGEELAPIAQESNLNADYLENRVFNKVSKLLPGDHVTVECTYNTYEREQFTLGGDSVDEEICTATLMYYPRQDQLVSCNSQTNVGQLLKALGIEKLS
jgi:Copper type II ascorbate-dependent monooxygenase, C-terminal domain/Copper type II ascorbate-dependent monooxygenase, N-terminal domain